ncbi:hypothetical protein Q9L58_002937 [Maublancomyces gigas]|uniref:Secreted protein n=1 Tax=Discina gigas TaxID=1032678 RepID=A0ABR3GQ12_9PEZI
MAPLPDMLLLLPVASVISLSPKTSVSIRLNALLRMIAAVAMFVQLAAPGTLSQPAIPSLVPTARLGALSTKQSSGRMAPVVAPIRTVAFMKRTAVADSLVS